MFATLRSSSAQCEQSEELKKKLKAKIAGHALDRTQGLEKGVQDSNGLILGFEKYLNLLLLVMLAVHFIYKEEAEATSRKSPEDGCTMAQFLFILW